MAVLSRSIQRTTNQLQMVSRTARSRSSSTASSEPQLKRPRLKSPPDTGESDYGQEYGPAWSDWPAPLDQMKEARAFIREAVQRKDRILIVPDKDADGLSAGTLMYKTLVLLGVSEEMISVHHLSKGNNVHSPMEREIMEAAKVDCAIVLDQGSRPGPPLLGNARCLVIDHHQSSQFPEKAQVLTACNTLPIATASLLTYILLRDMHPKVRPQESWRALVGTFGDLGPKAAIWGQPPWPGELATVLKSVGSKNISDCVAAINAPRRTAEYNVSRAWDIYLAASGPRDVSNHAYLKLCKLDVSQETERWARTAPKFSADGRVALVTIDSGFQIHPVIATRWAGNLGRKSKKLVMVMCANQGYNPDHSLVSFSCRISASMRDLPESERPNLIELLKSYGSLIPDFTEAVGENFARGHKEATGGIIAKTHFQRLIDAIGIGATPSKRTPQSPGKTIKDFFKPV